jgi:hypothetical protein
MSARVEPFMLPPARSTSWKCSPFFTLAEPWNIMCSNRCAKPVRPGRSLRAPTSYHTSTAATCDERSGARMTVRPLPSW